MPRNNPKRTQRRIAASQAFDRQIAKERTIGPDPQFDHARGMSEEARKIRHAEWTKQSRAYNEGQIHV